VPDFQRPKINNANKTFWEEIKNEKFLLQQCNDCNEIFFPPRIICPECLSDHIKYIESRGRGILYAFTEIHGRAPGFKTPFVIGLIELDEKPGRFLSRIEAPYETLRIGQKMKVQYVHKKKFSVHTFIPD